MSKIAVAVVGCGSIANTQHLPALSRNPRVTLKYCVDIVGERAKAAAETYGAQSFLRDYREILGDGEVQAVFVLTPNHTHAGITIDCLNAGKNVFCEKPISLNYRLSCQMAEAAKKNRRLLNIGVCNRFHRTVNLVKEEISAGRLGELYHVYCSFRAHRAIPGLGGYFTTKSDAGGGVLIDWGVHFLDLVLYATGLPKVLTVSANCYNRLGKNIPQYAYTDMWAGPPNPDGVCDVEEFVSGFLRTEGYSVSLNGAWAQNIGKDEMFVDFLGDRAGVRLDYGGKYTLYTARGGALVTETREYSLPSMYVGEQEAFLNAVETGDKTRCDIEYVLETARVMDGIYRSAELNREIAL